MRRLHEIIIKLLSCLPVNSFFVRRRNRAGGGT